MVCPECLVFQYRDRTKPNRLNNHLTHDDLSSSKNIMVTYFVLFLFSSIEKDINRSDPTNKIADHIVCEP